MAFKIKLDRCGLTAVFSTALAVRDDTENKSNEVWRGVSNDGDIFAEEVYGDDSSPANSYALKAAINATAGALTIGAGAIVEIGNLKFARETVTISTGAGTPVAISATAQQLEADASTANAVTFAVPAFQVSTRHVSQDIFGAIESITNATLSKLDHSIACSITKDKLVGDIVSSNANSGLITIQGTLLQKSTLANAAEPAVEVVDGWTLSKRPTRTNPESAYPEFSFEISRPLQLVTSS